MDSGSLEELIDRSCREGAKRLRGRRIIRMGQSDRSPSRFADGGSLVGAVVEKGYKTEIYIQVYDIAYNPPQEPRENESEAV